MIVQEETPPYTPRSKSLDLLRANAASPITGRNSVDTISTLRGHRISSPIFLNSSVGVKPLPEEPRLEPCKLTGAIQVHHDELDTFESSPPSSHSTGVPGLDSAAAKARASTMPRYLTGDILSQPKTPSRRQLSSDQLKSKFSMSPVQQSKRSKARVLEDRASANRLPDGVLSQDIARSTLGNWSHSIGMAARKLQKSTLPSKASDESYQPTLDATQERSSKFVTPEKGKASLRSATSLASIRRFMTPSRRTRKVSSRGFGSRSRAMLTVDDTLMEHFPAGDSNEDSCWVDADGRPSRDGLSQTQDQIRAKAATSMSSSFLMFPNRPYRSNRKAQELSESDQMALRRRLPLPTDLYEPPSEEPAQEHSPKSDGSSEVLSSHEISAVSTPPTDTESAQFQGVGEALSSLKNSGTSTEQPPTAPAPSKLKTLQLLARRPFNAFGKKMREMEKSSWWPTRSSQDLPDRSGGTSAQQVTAPSQGPPTRCSEDLLSKASPRVCDASTMAQKSRSVELDRIQLPSKVVPLRSSGVAAYKRRPLIPDAFAKPPPPPRPPTRESIKAIPTARISDHRHPWMKQLQLPAASTQGHTNGGTAAKQSEEGQIWPKMRSSEPPSARSIPTFSLTEASLTMVHPSTGASVPMLKKQSPRRPPASLLGQSLPIPPRSGRSRASTISSQSSTTSSPSGKIIVSRRSYGQRLRSPSTREETGSIRSVGTSILFTESPPASPGMRKFMSPYHITRSPSAVRVRSPPTTVLLPKYSPRRGGKGPSLHRKPSSAFSTDSDIIEEQEWVDDAPFDNNSTTALHELTALRNRLEDVLPPRRPGFLEMNEATQTLSNLVKTFSGSSPSLSPNASPYKKMEAGEAVTSAGSLYGIMEADESSLVRSPPAVHHLHSARQRLISIASIVSTEANSSFEDSEELQKLLDSIMAADLGNSSDTSASRGGDMALLSPFGSPADMLETRKAEYRFSQELVKEKTTQTPTAPLAPPPKFLLNDRPISPPDSSCTSHETTHLFNVKTGSDNATINACHRGRATTGNTFAGLPISHSKLRMYDELGSASVSIWDSYHARQSQ
ncbi:hypothetical protein NDA11_004530 [Ustilago hordei]|uniref:Uncharacterized protein n=1 Tax=Ustilago hordei TaxID=120017 RepID=I2G0J8_USTHO|nr:uncharacterized protein UHO2_03508 [Ustilago hordei]KAJ1044296.1 hypothetical protein NDA10_007407 [Ustilago hordei]KAJ1579187.1 hypothetical protein NDA15_007784 [Ustilago hordei]KAJ1580755.1 hypothetical protein NDA12_005830 [Ustilago hordei]KAJ1581494.1 hypothetical protein NDA11_004530 [Ustilago hordei]UTT91869.1 hypothetical protein NDA17_002915 [Ustilago hordei]